MLNLYILYKNDAMKNQFPFNLIHLKNKESRVLYLAMFIMGACGLAYEYTLSKISGDILGNSVHQWAAIIAVMMFFMGIGADLQKYFRDEKLSDYFIVFETLLGLIGGFGPIAFIYVFGNYPYYFVPVQYFFIIAIGLIIGFEIPLITRINEQYTNALKLNLASVLKMDYIGSLAGALLWIFLLPLLFEQVQSAFFLGGLNALVALLTYVYFKKHLKHPVLNALVLLVTIVSLGFGYLHADKWRAYSEQFLYRDPIVYSHTTIYQHLVLTKTRSGTLSLYINGHLQFNSSDEFIYHENLVHPAMMLAPVHRNVLILGGGDGLALREVLKYPNVRQVTLCDLDPEMTRIAKENPFLSALNQSSFSSSRTHIVENRAIAPGDTFQVFEGNQHLRYTQDGRFVQKVHLFNMDAVNFVDQIDGMFDVIILDFPDPNAVDLGKLYSLSFYKRLKKHLAVDGLIVQQSTSPYHAREVFLAVGRTMRAAGLVTVPYKDNVPSFGEWGWWLAAHPTYFSAELMQKKLQHLPLLPVPTNYLTNRVVAANLIFNKGGLKANETFINTLGNNVIYRYYLNAWQNE